MLKNFGYDGTYRDRNISISVLLENPLDYDLEAATLVFSVTVKDKRNGAENLGFESCTFYIMDEQSRIYNTQKVPGVQPNTQAAEDSEPICSPDGLILADFRHEFLFQDLRIVFYEEAGQQFHIIRLKH